LVFPFYTRSTVSSDNITEENKQDWSSETKGAGTEATGTSEIKSRTDQE